MTSPSPPTPPSPPLPRPPSSPMSTTPTKTSTLQLPRLPEHKLHEPPDLHKLVESLSLPELELHKLPNGTHYNAPAPQVLPGPAPDATRGCDGIDQTQPRHAVLNALALPERRTLALPGASQIILEVAPLCSQRKRME